MATKTQLTVKMNLLEADLILAKGGTQKEIREKFGDALGQKLYCILVLNKRFPASNIVHRLSELSEADPRHIRFASVKGPDLPRLVLRSDPKTLEDQNRKEQTLGRDKIPPLQEEDLDDYLCPPRCNEPKIMSKANIHALSQHAPIAIVRDVAKAILNNDIDILNKKYFGHTDAISLLTEAFSK